MTVEVIAPLVSLKVRAPTLKLTRSHLKQDTQERIRKRIREDLKEAITAHTDYAENVYPKLQRTYLKKAQDAEVRD